MGLKPRMSCVAQNWPSRWRNISNLRIWLSSSKFTKLCLLVMAFLSEEKIIETRVRKGTKKKRGKKSSPSTKLAVTMEKYLGSQDLFEFVEVHQTSSLSDGLFI